MSVGGKKGLFISKRSRGGALGIFLMAVLFALPSCEIGLGESVDTENPKVEITNPESNVIIRDKFVMNGTWSDDGIVKEIAITLVNTDTGKVYNFSTPTINDGTWSFTVDPFAEGIKDGPYSLSVLAKDAYAHETFASAAFSIDNTPPLVVLQRPSTVFGGTKFDSYGQEFTLKGQAADDSNVDSVIVEIFDAANFSDESVPLTTVTIPNVPPTIDLTVAKFGDAAYTKIYGDKKDEGTKRFVCKITAFDSARKVPAVEGDKGNSITYFYLYNDVYSELLKEFKVTELYKILSDNYTGTNVDGAKAALEKLQNAQYTGFSRIVKSSFSLNPLNNPTYDVSGYADLYSNGYNLENKDEVKLLNNSKLVLNFKAGLDEATILSDTIGVSLVLCDKNGNPLTGADAHEWELIKPYKDSNGNELFSQTDPYYAKRDARISTVGTGCSIIVEVGTKASADKFEPSDLILGGYYRFKITGSDANGNRILATLEDINSDYAFLLNSSGSVPTLIATASKVDSTGETAVQNTFDITSAQSVKLSGSSTIEEGEVEINVTLTKSDGTEIAYTKTTTPAITITEDTSGVNKKYLFTITIPNSEFGEGQNTVTVSTNKKNEVQVVDKAFTVNVDRTSPEISDITVDGMDYTDGTYLNGIITIKAVASDNEALESAWYEVYKGTDTIYTEKTSITPAALRSTGFKINTRDYYLKSGSVYDKGDITVKIYAKDKAGNETTGAKIGTITLAIDQSTDIPKMDFETSVLDNVNCAETDISLTANRNIFKTSDNLELTISDDDGIKSVTMVYKYTENGTQKQENVSLPAFKVGQKEYTISKKVTDLGFVEGYGKVQIEVTDNADTTWEGIKQTWDESKKTSNEINIFVYESPITISAYNGTKKITDANSVRDVNDDFEVIIKVTEKDGHLDSITWTDDAGGSGEITTVNKTTDAEQSFTETIPKPANSTKVKRTYTATNKFGISETVSFTYNFDLDDPTLKNPTATYWTYDDSKSAKQNVKQSCDSEFYYDATKTLTVYVEAEDKGKTSPDTEEFQTDVASVEYAIVKGKQSAWVDTWTTASEIKQDWVPATPKTNAPYEIQIPADVFSETDEGQYTVFMRAIDNVGNKSAYKYANIIADKKHPEIETTTSIADNNKDDVTISGKVSEKYLQDFTVTVEKKNGAGWDKVTKSDTTYIETVPTAGTYTSAQDWSVTVKKATSQANDGVYKVTVTAKDNVGKQTPWTSKEFRIDTKEPELNTADNNFKIGNTNHAGIETKWYNATSLRLEGFYEDAGSGISEVKYTLTPAGATSANPEETITATEGAAGKYNFNATISGFTNSTTSPVADNTLTLQTTDLAGNKSGVSTYTIKVDTNPPTITTTSTVTVDSVDETLTQGNSKLVNGKKDITIKITVTDGESGIATTEIGGSKVSTGVKLAIGNKTFDKQATQVSTSDEYTYTIPANTFTTAGMKTVYAKATDAAGNESEEMLFSFMVDTKGPTLSFTSHGDGVPVNKEITISGMASDDQQLAQVKLSVSVDGGSNYTELGDSTATSPTLTLSNSAWSYTLDTDDAAYNGKTITLKVTGVDAAGNENSETLTLNVDQNTDRPVVKVTNLTEPETGKYTLMYGTNASISGSVSDDDAISTSAVKTFIASSSAITAETAAETPAVSGTSYDATFVSYDANDKKYKQKTKSLSIKLGDVVYTYKHEKVSETTGLDDASGTLTAYDVTVFTPSSGEWTFYPYNIDDGNKEVYFFVKDNKDAEFYTTYATGTTDAEKALGRPYFQFKTDPKVDNSTKLEYKSDGNSPVVSRGSIFAYNNSDEADEHCTENNTAMSTALIVGGTEKQHIKFQIKASDNNGIAGMTLLAKGNNGTEEIARIATKTGYEGYENTSGSFSSTIAEGDATWTTGLFDLNGRTTGAVTVEVNVYDQSGLKGNASYTFNIDNTPPSVSVLNPQSTEEQTGIITVNGLSQDEGGSSVEKTEWLIPTTAQKGITDATLATQTWNDNKESMSSETAWKFTFNGNTDGCPLLTTYDSTNYAISTTDGIYVLPIYFKVTDALGNYHIEKSYTLKHNPDGDKPRTTFTYPTVNDYGKDSSGNVLDYAVLGGTIRITGNVTIPNPNSIASVKSVYVQIGAATTNASGKQTCSFSAADKAKAGTGTGTGNYGYTVVDKNTTGTNAAGITSGASDDWWGIKATNTSSSWNIVLNAGGELNPSSGTNNIAIRACGVNSEGKCGAWSETYYIHIDNTAPQAKVSLRQYDSITKPFETTATTLASAKVTAQQPYEAGLYLKGDWFLYAEIDDETAVTSITVSNSSTSTKKYESAEYTTSSGRKGYKVWVPISKVNGTYANYTITATDADHAFTGTYDFYLDNTAPVIGTLSTTASGSAEFTSNHKIQDSSLMFYVASDVTETGSGFDRAVFYFLRNWKTSGSETLIDPFDFKADGTTPKKTKVENLDKVTVKQGTESYNLYGKKVTGGSSPSTTSFKGSGIYDNSNIRVGGLIYIDGMFHRIKEIASDGTVTFEGDASGTATEAVFIYAQVVDNTLTENGTAVGNNFTITGDDGDGMPEKVTKIANGVTWDGYIRSTNLADGPAKLVVLVFDKAGNVACREVESYVSNNAPRIAKLYLGTDLNGNESYSADEFESYSIATRDSKTDDISGETDAATVTTGTGSRKKFTVKNKLLVVPEIVGGNLKENSNLMMIYKLGASDTTAIKLSEETAKGTYKPGISLTDLGFKNFDYTKPPAGETFTSKYTMPAFELTNNQLAGLASGTISSDTHDGDKEVSFTFWDDTEDAVKGINSQHAVVYIPDIVLDLYDSTKPNVVINKFFWKSKDVNSLYDNSTANGHIELEDDLTFTGSTFTGSSGLTDKDPKVSGKIVVRGTAYDDVCLSSLSVNFGSISNVLAATYDATEGWILTKTKDASNNDVDRTLENSGWIFKVYDANSMTSDMAKSHFGVESNITDVNAVNSLAYFGQAGHKVAWELVIDTETVIATKAALDQSLTVTAKDTTGNTSSERGTSEAAGDGTMHRPTYKMDVVPYVTKVTTGLSSLTRKEAKKSVYDRTALGHYPVASTETIVLEGFNIGTNEASVTDGTKTVKLASVGGKNNALTIGELKSTSWTLSVGTGVNKVDAINNLNNNNAKGNYDGTGDKAITDTQRNYSILSTYAYNRKPNNDNNNLLTDDLIFDVWEFNSEAAVPISGKIEQPHMKIDPVTGQIGFAFVNGPLYFSMPGVADSNATTGADNTKTSYNYWCGSYDFFTSVSLAYDDLGNSYATAAGGDINSDPSTDRFIFMSNRFGHEGRSSGGAYGGHYRLEAIGERNADGVTNFDKQRIKSPTIATSVKNLTNSTATNVYLAYYDQINAEVRFNYGTYFDSEVDKGELDEWETEYTDYNIEFFDNDPHFAFVIGSVASCYNGRYGDKVQLLDAGDNIINKDGATDNSAIYYAFYNNNEGTQTGTTRIKGETQANTWTPPYGVNYVVPETNNYCWVGISSDRKANGNLGIPYAARTLRVYKHKLREIADVIQENAPAYRTDHIQVVASENLAGRNPGQYVSLGVVPGLTLTNDVVVMCWYDETNRQLLYSYTENPLSIKKGDTVATGWSTPQAIFSDCDYDNAGEYCQIAVDVKGGIHIAAYDPVNSDLVYAYTSSYNADFRSCIVDGNGVVGNNITIDVALDSSNKIMPQIGYYATSAVRPKYARLTKAGELSAGTEDDEFTGDWECTLVPTSSTINMQSNQYNKINVGVWKDAGVITNSKTGTSSHDGNGQTDYNATSYGYCYGNGTQNAVLGYTIKVNASNDAIETAQMR